MMQIQEPGKSPAKKNSKTHSMGIDLGTTHSLVAVVCDDSPQVLSDAKGEKIIPSVVYYGKDGAEVEVGAEAIKHQADDPANCIFSVKRLIGRGMEEIEESATKHINSFTTNANKQPLIKTNQGDKSPVEVSADILKYLDQFARLRMQDRGEIDGAVITVPAYFDDAQRQAVKDAARLAGIKLYRLLNEPTAAAVAYALDQKASGQIAVYDMGGGTFDISILRLEKGVFRVLAAGGNSALGGDDFDFEFAKFIARKLGLLAETEASLGKLDIGASQGILALAKYAKEQLSDSAKLELDANDIRARLPNSKLADVIAMNLKDGGKLALTRKEFEGIISPYVAESLQIMNNTLKDAKLDKSAIDDLVLVGGSTRIPYIREQLAQHFGKQPLCSIDPDLVVAMGASIQADVLAGNRRDSMLLLDVIPLSLGLETMGGLNEKLIPRNSSIPVSATHDFTTYKDGQTAMSFHIVQGERELIQDCRSLAHFTLRGIPPQVAGAARVRVTFRVDADGLLSVMAQELSTGKAAEVEVHPTYGLDEKDFKQILEKSFAMADNDKKLRTLKQKQTDAEQLLQMLEKALGDKDCPPTDAESKLIKPAQDQLAKLSKRAAELVAKSDAAGGLSELENAITELDKGIASITSAAEPFIARRMTETLKKNIK